MSNSPTKTVIGEITGCQPDGTYEINIGGLYDVKVPKCDVEINDPVVLITEDKPSHACDNVNKPAHYNQGGVETIDYILQITKGLQGNEAYLVGNVLRYVSRYKLKGGKQDLEKAQVYLGWLINYLNEGKIR
jgi:hypothetical protein